MPVTSAGALRAAWLALVISACDSRDHAYEQLAAEVRQALPAGVDPSRVEQALQRLGFEFSYNAATRVYFAKHAVPGDSPVKRVLLLQIRMGENSRVRSVEFREGLVGP